MGDEVTTSRIGKKRCRQYKYSAKERVDKGKYFTEVIWFPYVLCHLGNTSIIYTKHGQMEGIFASEVIDEVGYDPKRHWQQVKCILERMVTYHQSK